jgi:hypothetical protein
VGKKQPLGSLQWCAPTFIANVGITAGTARIARLHYA